MNEILCKSSERMDELSDNSVHLIVTRSTNDQPIIDLAPEEVRALMAAFDRCKLDCWPPRQMILKMMDEQTSKELVKLGVEFDKPLHSNGSQGSFQSHLDQTDFGDR